MNLAQYFGQVVEGAIDLEVQCAAINNSDDPDGIGFGVQRSLFGSI